MNRRLVDTRFAFFLIVPALCASSALGAETAAEQVEIPAGASSSVVVVVTKQNDKVVAIETGLVVASEADRSTIYVDALRLSSDHPLPGKPEERTAVAIVGRGAATKQVVLEKSYELSNGTTLYTGKKSELPPPLPKTSDVVVSEGMPLVVIGYNPGGSLASLNNSAKSGPEIVALKTKVDRIFRSAETLEARPVVEAEQPSKVRRGILTTPDGKIVAIASAVEVPQLRLTPADQSALRASHGIYTTDGHRRFDCKPLAEIERAAEPDLPFFSGNFKISGGKARVDFALVVDDPFDQLKNPRLLVSFKNRGIHAYSTHPTNDTTSIDSLSNEATVTVRGGVWIDRVDGDLEVPLKPATKLDPSFEKLPYNPLPKRGKFFIGSCTFDAPGALPFVAQCVVDDEQGRMTTLGTGDCLGLKPELDAKGRSLRRSGAGVTPPQYAR